MRQSGRPCAAGGFAHARRDDRDLGQSPHRAARRSCPAGEADSRRTACRATSIRPTSGSGDKAAAIFQRYLRMTRQAIGRGRALRAVARVVDAVHFERRSAERRAGAALARERPGADPASAAIRSSAARRPKYYNSAFLVRPDGADGGVYRKMHLVPFGEYVPLKQLLFFAAPLVEAVVGFFGRRRGRAAAGRRPSRQHGDLLRDRLSGSGAAVRAWRAASC